MNKFSNFLHTHINKIIVVLLFLLIAACGYLLFAEGERQTEKIVRRNQAAASEAESEATAAATAAAQAAVERTTEDRVRDRTIKPKLEESRRESKNSKKKLENVTRKYNDEKNNSKNLNSSDADNCLRLAVLFPDTRFESCK